ncbi:MAG: zinc ABC transporter substrate-binding protein [Clostridiales bacterium]|nr:zinc ABC transporter substrate-binding protein [Clostridiales bacterium]
MLYPFLRIQLFYLQMRYQYMKKLLSFLLALCLLPPVAGLAREEKIEVVASFYPVYILAKNVLDEVEGVSLSSMTTPATGCLHDYQLLTSDIRALSRAHVFLINGAGMEGFLPDIMDQLPDLKVVDCSQGVGLLCADEEHDHDHHHDHDHGEYNAHIWLDPENAVIMVENIRAALALALPDQADRINDNAAAYTARLLALDAELEAALAPFAGQPIVTFHESFPYFAKAYGLHVAAIVAMEPDAPLSPRMVAQVVDTVREAGNPPLFAEPQYRSAALRAISQETGAPVYPLDPLATGPDCLTAYEDTMRSNLSALLEALSQ